METHYNLTDPEFENQFKNCSLDPQLFNHEAHLRLAWIHISKYGLHNAVINITEQLQAFVKYAGASDKYNHTVTIAAIKAVDHYYRKSRTNTFKDFLVEFPQLKDQFKDLMHFHYKTNIFISEKAKTDFIEPDRSPFD